MCTVEHSVSRILHDIHESVHGYDVVGIRAVTDELRKEGGVMEPVIHAESPVKASAGSPFIAEYKYVSVGFP